VYLHREDGEQQAEVAPIPTDAKRQAIAAPETLDKVYQGMLNALQLSLAHRANLRERGLPEEVIERTAYRSFPVGGRARLAQQLRARHSEAVLSVPGFVVKKNESGREYLTIAGSAGLLIPIRAIEGRIVRLMVRSDGKGASNKYTSLSSAKFGGPGATSVPHVPLGTPTSAEVIRLTEGALKSDIAFALSGVPTIGAPGVANWGICLAPLQALGARAVRWAQMSLQKEAKSLHKSLHKLLTFPVKYRVILTLIQNR